MFCGASDAPQAGDIDSRRHRPKRRPWRAAAAIGARLQLRPSHGLRRPDARKRLTAGQVVAARRSAAHRTRREPKMRIEPQIVLRGGRDGRRRRSARSLCGPSDRQSCCRPSGLPQRTPPSLRRSTRGEFDAPRTGDADRAADRPQRRPWWAAVAFRARLRLCHRMCCKGRYAEAACGGTDGRSTVCGGAFDAHRAVDADRVQKRGQRRPW